MTATYHADRIREIITEIDSELAAACRVAFVKAGPVDTSVAEQFNSWLSAGFHAGMRYMENHSQVRRNPVLLLDDPSAGPGNERLPETATIMIFAFSYNHGVHHPGIASYALGYDYHDVLRKRLSSLTDRLMQFLKEHYGHNSKNEKFRICIDSAPLHERYWAVKAGLGYPTRNGNIVVPGLGSMVFLASIITTLDIIPDTPLPMEDNPCRGCGACLRICPAGALRNDGTIDSRRCLNYLTIEHRGEWDEEASRIIRASGGAVFGCDACLKVCPLNQTRNTLPEFRPRPEILNLTPERIQGMTQEEFSTLFKGSPIKRCKLSGLKRNLTSLPPHQYSDPLHLDYTFIL